MASTRTTRLNPAQQGKRKPRGNGNPPAEHRFKPGQSGNPAGRPSAGAAVAEWLNAMQGWSREELLKVINDQAAPVAKIAAARSWYDASSKDRNAAGNPLAVSDLGHICDRTAGKPINRVDVAGEVDVTFTLNISNASGSDEPSEN